MDKHARRQLRLAALAASLLIAAASAAGSEQAQESPFQYAGGTEKVEQNCAGNLEVTAEALVFKCPMASISVPFPSITLMQYRSDLSRRVRRLKLKWHARPEPGGGKRNRYFTVVYKDQDATHIVVLKVSPRSMRPYLAEIDLKSGKRVEVMGYEDYR